MSWPGDGVVLPCTMVSRVGHHCVKFYCVGLGCPLLDLVGRHWAWSAANAQHMRRDERASILTTTTTNTTTTTTTTTTTKCTVIPNMTIVIITTKTTTTTIITHLDHRYYKRKRYPRHYLVIKPMLCTKGRHDT